MQPAGALTRDPYGISRLRLEDNRTIVWLPLRKVRLVKVCKGLLERKDIRTAYYGEIVPRVSPALRYILLKHLRKSFLMAQALF